MAITGSTSSNPRNSFPSYPPARTAIGGGMVPSLASQPSLTTVSLAGVNNPTPSLTQSPFPSDNTSFSPTIPATGAFPSAQTNQPSPISTSIASPTPFSKPYLPSQPSPFVSPITTPAMAQGAFSSPANSLGNSVGAASFPARPPANSNPYSASPLSAQRPATSPLGAPSGLNTAAPQSSAQQIGSKIGEIASEYLEKNPALTEKLSNVDLDALQQDLEPKLEYAQGEAHEAFKYIPRALDKKLIDIPDSQENKEIVRELIKKVRQQPSPSYYQAKQEKERLKAQEEKMNRLGMEDPIGSDPYMDEDLSGASDAEEPKPKQGLIAKAKERIKSHWPFNRGEKKEKLSDSEMDFIDEPSPSRSSRSSHGSGRKEEISDAELEAMLSDLLGPSGGGRGSSY